MNSKKIILEIAKKRMTKYVQAIEISAFLVSGYLLHLAFFEAGLMFIIGIMAAVIASESAIKEYELKKGEDDGTRRSA